jgi:hypothetical protein
VSSLAFWASDDSNYHFHIFSPSNFVGSHLTEMAATIVVATNRAAFIFPSSDTKTA